LNNSIKLRIENVDEKQEQAMRIMISEVIEEEEKGLTNKVEENKSAL
jgi:hypothetical protein